MFWDDKANPDCVFMDNRNFESVLCDGRQLHVRPDIIADFRSIPFPDESFWMVVFDPPHLLRAGKNSWLAEKYGTLPEDWQSYISKGFTECLRVLKKNGTLIMKWNSDQIKFSELMAVLPRRPLYGSLNGRANKTLWMVFMK